MRKEEKWILNRKSNRIILALIGLIIVSKLILITSFPEIICDWIFLPISMITLVGIIFLWMLYVYNLHNKKLFDLFTAVGMVIIFMLMGATGFILMSIGVSYREFLPFLLIFLGLIILVAGVHAYLSRKMQLQKQ